MTEPQAQSLERALAHHRAGELEAAEALYRRVLADSPRHADALHLLGVVAHQRGQHEQAAVLFVEAIKVNPGVAHYHNNLGEALFAIGRADQAVTAYRTACALEPDNGETHNNFGIALQAIGRLPEAISAFEQARRLAPRSVEAHFNLAAALHDSGRLEEAIEGYRQALALAPDDPEIHSNLGVALKDHHQLEEASAAFARAISLRPDFAEAHANLGSTLARAHRLTEAIEAFDKALRLAPNMASVHCNRGAALLGQGRHEEAIACYRRALALAPGDSGAHSSLLQAMHYAPSSDPVLLREEAMRWADQHAAPLAAEWRRHENNRDAERRLRVGYVSANFRGHPVGWFMAPVLTQHDKAEVEVFCYSAVARSDKCTEVFRSHADHWREIVDLNDAALADQIRADAIDVLVDLSGHTTGHRLLAFARKPAPVQITAGGHYDTTGMDAIDYLIGDRFHLPPGAERYFTETLIRMPNDYVCYQPPVYAPAVVDPPFARKGYVVFGCYNDLAKINERVVALWARILNSLPGSHLRIQNRQLADASTAARYRELFSAQGIGTERLALLGPLPHAALLAAYGEIDIALDPFPYSGGLTTCEALWMGVPVVTLTGETFCGRHSTSHLSNVGLSELTTTTPAAYAETALALATDGLRLTRLRRELRDRMVASPLCDTRVYTRVLEETYRTLWKGWCETSSS